MEHNGRVYAQWRAKTPALRLSITNLTKKIELFVSAQT